MVRNTYWIAALALAITMVVMGCASPSTPAPGVPPAEVGGDGEVIIKQAPVDSVELLLMESFPMQMRALVRGDLPDGCTEISHSGQTTEGNVIRIDLFTRRPAGAICTQALVRYEENILVDILGLPAGDYVVSVNGVEASFSLDVDNVPPDVE